MSLLLIIGCGSLGGRKVEPLAEGASPQRPPSLYVAREYSPGKADVTVPRPGMRGSAAEVQEDPYKNKAEEVLSVDARAELVGTAGDSSEVPVRVASAGEGAPNVREGLPRLVETVPDEAKPVTPVPAPEGPAAPTTQPVDAAGEPYRLNVDEIMRRVYEKSPVITSSRENMNAAQHALTEFRANLSRREPFLTATGDYSLFPERRDSEGIAGETTGGVEMETFDGARIRLEGGVRGERVEFGEVGEGQDDVEAGSGGVVRARVEMPFAGSRIRQNRVISQAFQESSARKAVIDYVTKIRTYVEYALTYYDAALYYRDYVVAYQHQLDELNALAARPDMKPSDLARIESVAGDTRVLIEGYQTSYRSYLLLLLEYLGLGPDDAYVLEERPLEDASKYYYMALTEEGRRQMVEEAFENNMQFRVLADAIADSKLKRQQAIEGKLDITTFVDGTQYAFGSESFDDRVGGWLVQGGVTLRLNDPRVLTASREKAEAEIRQFEAEILAEKLRVQRQVIEESSVLASYHESRPKVLENLEQVRAEYEQRSRAYFSGSDETLSIDDVLTSLSSITVAEARLASNVYYSRLSEDELLSATGEVYRRVGLEIDEQAAGGGRLREHTGSQERE